jgi:Tfp pilus assembly protein PilF
MVEEHTAFGIATAQNLLGAFSCLEVKAVESAVEADKLRQALILLSQQADFVNLGICADTPEQGLRALASYAKALGYSIEIAPADLTAAIAPVYIKFNGQRQTYYLDSYTGTYRGVLVSCHSLVEESINGTYGYLPLELFEGVVNQ